MVRADPSSQFVFIESRRPERELMWSFPPAELRYGPAESLGDLLVKHEHLWLRCEGCRHVAVLHPAVLAKAVGYDCKLTDLKRRLTCTKCGAKRVRVGRAAPGER